MKKVHVVPHMHWDREWYFSTEESRILLVNNMEEIMEMLETNPDYPYYVLDGQTSILEDYFAVKPENKERVRKLVQEGRLIIGPWYTQTDEMVVGGESIIRNLLYGIKDTKEFGDYMKIGYLPDSFGQSSQLPQILNGFDIKYTIFWRGTSERHGTDKTEFYWESSDGSKVLVQLLPLGYAIGKYLPTDEAALKDRMEKYLPVLDNGATTEHQILPNGHDQMPIQKNIFEVMEKLRELYPDREFFLSKYENILEEIEKNPNLDTISGEFLDGKYMRVHRSIYSTRADIKAANTRIENKITNILEPLASIAHSLGFEYHHGLIELIWKEIMKNHAHDSIGCCCSDKVHREIMSRFMLAEEKTDQLIAFYQRKIVDSIETNRTEDRLSVFNLLPYARTEVFETSIISKYKNFQIVDENNNPVEFELIHKEEMDPGLIDRQIVHYGNYDPFMHYDIQLKDTISAMGYKTYYIVETAGEVEVQTNETSSSSVETDFFNIQVNPNGTFNIFDKETEQTFENVFLMENGGDDGDEYDFSPLADETLIYSKDVVATSTITQTAYMTTIDVEYKLNVPANLEQRLANVRNSYVDIKLTLRIPNHQAIIKLDVTVDNQAEDHRLRMLVPSEIAAKTSVSDNQFGTIERPVVDSAMDVWEKEGWDERPDSIYPMLSFAGISNDKYGVAVATNSVREFEVVGENFNTLAITLFRSIGHLGKEEMLRRPGRPSGIKLPTPDSQMKGVHTFELALLIHHGTATQANVARLAKEFTTPIQFYNKIPYNAMKLNPSGIATPESYSFLEEESKELVLSVLKKSENADTYVARFYNASDANQTLEMKSNAPEVHLANLNEEIRSQVQVTNNQTSASLKPNQVQSFLLAKTSSMNLLEEKKQLVANQV